MQASVRGSDVFRRLIGRSIWCRVVLELGGERFRVSAMLFLEKTRREDSSIPTYKVNELGSNTFIRGGNYDIGLIVYFLVIIKLVLTLS